MKIAVFDTCVQRPDARRMYVDIVLPDAGKSHTQVLAMGLVARRSRTIP